MARLRWPWDAEDTLVFGGAALASVGAGSRWGWETGAMVQGGALVMMGLAPHVLAALIGRRGNAR